MGFGELCWVHLGGQMQGSKQHFGPRLGPSLAVLGMVCHVEAICQILFGHDVGFASRNAPPQQDQDFKWVSASYVGSIWGVKSDYLMATLVPSWGQLRRFWGCVNHFGQCCFGIVKNNPQIHLRNAPPPGPEGETESNQKLSQNTKTPPKR